MANPELLSERSISTLVFAFLAVLLVGLGGPWAPSVRAQEGPDTTEGSSETESSTGEVPVEVETSETEEHEASEVETRESSSVGPAKPAMPGPKKVPAARKALPEPVLEPAAHYAKALEALEAGDADSAHDHFERALVGEPNRLRWGAEYRQAMIAGEAYDRCIDFWKALAEAHPDAPNAQLNLGYAYVDKIPVEGAITAVILANKALGHFGAALELEESWLAYYTRGNSYMYWPAIFNRTQLGIDDLEKALALAAEGEHRAYHGQAWAALGDAYWRLEQREKMRQTWKEGLERYPGTPQLEERLSREGAELDTFLEKHFETSTRVATHLRELWEAGDER